MYLLREGVNKKNTLVADIRKILTPTPHNDTVKEKMFFFYFFYFFSLCISISDAEWSKTYDFEICLQPLFFFMPNPKRLHYNVNFTKIYESTNICYKIHLTLQFHLKF